MIKTSAFLMTLFMLMTPLFGELTREELIKNDIDLGNIEIYEKEIDRTKKWTQEDVLNNQYCLGQLDHPEYSSFLEAFGENFNAYIFSHLHQKIANNKKYYLHMPNQRRLVYFRQDTTYFLQLVSVNEAEEEHVIIRYFTDDSMDGCIRSLPDSCKWTGNQTITYEKKCRVGNNVGKILIQDIIELSTTATEDEVSFDALLQAFKDCYKPLCYSIPFKCMEHSLNYDPVEVLNQIQAIADKINSDSTKSLTAYIDRATMTLKYSGTDIQIHQNADLNPPS